MRYRPTMLAVGVWACVLILVACGSGTADPPATRSPSATATTDRSAVPGTPDDVAFAQLMIAHHEQAIQMADLAATRAQSPNLKALALDIKAEQSREVTTLMQWLSWWGAPPALPGTAEGHEMSESRAGGPPIDMDVSPLAELSGADFDRLWLRMMITHHQGAIEMAAEGLALTRLSAVRAFATTLVNDQRREIAQMQGMQEPQDRQDD